MADQKKWRVIPESELWLHIPDAAQVVDSAVRWAEQNPPKESDLDKMAKKLTARCK